MWAGRFAAALLLLATLASANELTVDKRTLALDDSVTITITLDDAFAGSDVSSVPMRNLAADGPPSISRRFQWINGASLRQKAITINAHPLGAGEAIVGPLVLHGSGGQVETLPAIALQIMPDVAAQLTDPAAILRELLATGRDPIFVVAEADRRSVFAGEEVVVTWTLYNATNVQQYSMTEMPPLDDFWSEELRLAADQPQQTRLGGVVVVRMPIRRAALFPMRSGTLTIPPMGIAAAVLKRTRTPNAFGEYEGTVTEVRRRSGAVTIDVRPVPPGPPVAIVGDVDLQCGTPSQSNGGPVVIDVAVTGRANLRSIAPPQFAAPIDGTLQINDVHLGVDTSHDDATMERRWRYLIFPARDGFLKVPPLALRVLTPAGERRELRCDERLVEVTRAEASGPPPAATPKTVASAVRRAWIPASVAALLLIALAIAAPRVEKGRRIRREMGKILHIGGADIAASAEEWLRERGLEPATLLQESSDRGEAWRALRSATDQRLEADDAALRQRVRDLVIAVSR